MPAWGLTKAQRESENPPWGLNRRLLAPAKIYTDPVHQDIYLTVLEQWIVDSPTFQRLRRVKQLGTTHLVYPGATHTRFSHALGAVRVAQDLLDAVLAQRDGRHPIEDLFMQWETDQDPMYVEAESAKVVVLARLGALLHDIGHVPFGHSIEDDRKILISHDENRERFAGQWQEISAHIEACIEREVEAAEEDLDGEGLLESLRPLLNRDGELHRELEPLVISKAEGVKSVDEMHYPFVADLVGNTICADLLDYLLRDHLFTGLPAGLGHRFLSGFFVVPAGHGVNSRRLALNIMQNGKERPDVVSELLKALRYRYELSERALAHHAKLAADAMISKALEDWADALWLEIASDQVGTAPEHAGLLDRDEVAKLRSKVLEALQGEHGPKRGQRAFDGLTASLRERMEGIVLGHGDDGLLELMCRLEGSPCADQRVGATVDRLHGRASRLSARMLNRDLYQAAGRASLDNAPAEKLYEKFGAAEDRSRLERRAADFAELADPTSVLIWLPKPEMRMKPAKVLVDNGQTIKPFIEYEGKGRGQEIYRAHRDLWAVWIFLDRGISQEQLRIVLGFLAGEMGVRWEHMDEFRSRPGDWLTELAAAESSGGDIGDPAVLGLVKEVPLLAARRGDTYQDYKSAFTEELERRRRGGEP